MFMPRDFCACSHSRCSLPEEFLPVTRLRIVQRTRARVVSGGLHCARTCAMSFFSFPFPFPLPPIPEYVSHDDDAALQEPTMTRPNPEWLKDCSSSRKSNLCPVALKASMQLLAWLSEFSCCGPLRPSTCGGVERQPELDGKHTLFHTAQGAARRSLATVFG